MASTYKSIYTRKELEEQVKGSQTKIDGLQSALDGHQNALKDLNDKIGGVESGMQTAGQFSATLWGQTFTNSTKTIEGDLTSKGKITGTQGNFSGPVNGTVGNFQNVVAVEKVKGAQGQFDRIDGDTVFTGKITFGGKILESTYSLDLSSSSSFLFNPTYKYNEINIILDPSNHRVQASLGSVVSSMEVGQELYAFIKNSTSSQISLMFPGTTDNVLVFGGEIEQYDDAWSKVDIEPNEILEVSIIRLSRIYVRAAK